MHDVWMPPAELTSLCMKSDPECLNSVQSIVYTCNELCIILCELIFMMMIIIIMICNHSI